MIQNPAVTFSHNHEVGLVHSMEQNLLGDTAIYVNMLYPSHSLFDQSNIFKGLNVKTRPLFAALCHFYGT